MKKHMKRIVSLLLACVMTLAMAVTAFADDPIYYSITINNAEAEYQYTAYQIFSGTLDSTGTILSDIEIGNGVDNSALTTILTELKTNSAYSSANSLDDVIEVLNGKSYDSAEAQAFADAVGKHLTTGTASGEFNATAKTYTIAGLEPGYYLVQTTDLPNAGAYTRYMLAVVRNTSVTTKYDVPSVDKAVDKVDAEIGETVTYTLTASLPSNYADYDTYKLIFHDTLSKGLTYANNLEVKVGDTVVDSGFTAANAASGDDTAITVTIANTNNLKDANGDAIAVTKDSKIIVTFNATVNADAVIGGDGNPNKVYLEYSNNPNSGGEGETGETPEDVVYTWTYELDTTKIDKTTKEELEGAEFVLYKKDGEKTLYAVVTDGKVASWTATRDDATTLVSGEDGLFKVAGLDAGVTYFLEETKAPDGYNLLTAPFEFVINATYEEEVSDTDNDVVKLTGLNINGKENSGNIEKGIVTASIENSAGTTLPSTGGMGTTVFYVLGAVLMLGAGVVLFVRRRSAI